MARKTTRRKTTRRKAPARKASGRKTAKKAPARKRAARKTSGRKALASKAPSRKSTRSTGADAFTLQLELEALYAAYGGTLDHGEIEDWPAFFTEDCLYKLISRENYDLGLPLGTMFAEKQGGLQDRVVSVRKTTVYHERALTHLITGVRVLSQKGGVIEATANYAVLETLPNQYTKILNSGRYLDKIVRKGGKLLFQEKLCVFDSALVPASIIYPV